MLGTLIQCGTALGQTYRITTLGLQGEPYIAGTAYSMNSHGQVAGGSLRYTGNGTSDVWLYDGSSTVGPINLTGSDWEWHSGNVVTRSGFIGPIDEEGRAVGQSQRYSPAGSSRGSDSWFFNGASTVGPINLIGPGYEWNNGGTIHRQVFSASALAGRVLGTSQRFAPTGATRGYDEWIFDGVETRGPINLTGGGYEWDSSGTAVRLSNSSFWLNAAGHVGGNSQRYSPTGGSRGSDAWYFDGATTRLVGLTGAGYQWNNGGTLERWGTWADPNLSGFAIGATSRVSATGEGRGGDAWLSDGVNTLGPLNLVDGVYQWAHADGIPTRSVLNGSPLLTLPTGPRATGSSSRYGATGTDRGRDCWVFNGVSTLGPINLVGGVYHSNTNAQTFQRQGTVRFANAAGMVAGDSKRYSLLNDPQNSDAWLFDGAQTVGPINLTGSDYEWVLASRMHIGRYGSATALTSAGVVVGTSARFAPNGEARGHDVWYWDGSGTTRRINPVGKSYEWMNGGTIQREATADFVNAAGQVAGSAQRYSASGEMLNRVAWVYSPATGVTTELIVSVEPVTNDALSGITNFTEFGTAAGSYRLYSADGSSYAPRAFVWTAASGVLDLGDQVAGGLANAGWQYLASVGAASVPGVTGSVGSDARPKYVVASGLRVAVANVWPGLLRAECPADFDGDSFVTGTDFDLYVQAFEAGDATSDFDGDTFITGLDFDLYVQAFEAGC